MLLTWLILPHSLSKVACIALYCHRTHFVPLIWPSLSLEAGSGCKTLFHNILERQFELEYARDIVIERAHRTKIILEDGSIMNPRPIHAKLLNWEDKEFLLKIGPSRLKRNNYGFGVKIYVSDNVTKKVREDRKILRTRYLPDIRQKPGVKVAFIPFQVPARIQYKEGDSWNFIYLPNS